MDLRFIYLIRSSKKAKTWTISTPFSPCTLNADNGFLCDHTKKVKERSLFFLVIRRHRKVI